MHHDELWGPSTQVMYWVMGSELISAKGFIQLSHPPVFLHSHQYNKLELFSFCGKRCPKVLSSYTQIAGFDEKKRIAYMALYFLE